MQRLSYVSGYVGTADALQVFEATDADGVLRYVAGQVPPTDLCHEHGAWCVKLSESSTADAVSTRVYQAYTDCDKAFRRVLDRFPHVVAPLWQHFRRVCVVAAVPETLMPTYAYARCVLALVDGDLAAVPASATAALRPETRRFWEFVLSHHFDTVLDACMPCYDDEDAADAEPDPQRVFQRCVTLVVTAMGLQADYNRRLLATCVGVDGDVRDGCAMDDGVIDIL